MKFRATIVTILLFISINALAQDKPLQAIGLIARATGDSIVLRWAPSTPLAWKLLNKYGYQIERIIIVRDTAVLRVKTSKQLTSSPILPAQQSLWESQIDKNDYVAIAAQAIFGDNFNVTKKGTEGLSIVTKSQELESRHSFSLYAADLSIQAATLSGLRLVDRDVRKNEKYLYKVHSLIPKNILDVTSGLIFIGYGDSKPLIKPKKPELNFGDKSVTIAWDSRSLRDSYTGFNIEKSKDGKVFAKINKQPISALESTLPSGFTMAYDTLINNDQETFYRIIGLSPFGETGPPSESSSGAGVSLLDERAVITETKAVANTIHLQWRFAKGKEGLINGFEIERSNEGEKGFLKIGACKPSTREFIDQQPEATNYYRIVSLTKTGIQKTSLPVLLQLQDSIPPAIPLGLTIKIDSTGMATLRWIKNTERDLLGYRIYRSNFKNSEFSLVSDSLTVENQFQEQLNMQTLTSRAYYKINALDKRYNPSDYSDIVPIEIPDVVPPVAPIFTKLEKTNEGIAGSFLSSSSADIKEYKLYRIVGKQKPIFLRTFTLNDSVNFIDRYGEPNLVSYMIQSIDIHGLSSSPAYSPKIRLNGDLPKISDTRLSINRTAKSVLITWKCNKPNALKYLIFRAKNEEPLALYRIAKMDSQFEDREVEIGALYTYRIKGLFEEGIETKFSDAIKAKL